MQSSISRSSGLSARLRAAFAPVAVAWMFLAPPAAALAQSSWTSHPWLMLSAGYENDRLPDPLSDRYVLPGGSLVGVTPGIWITGRPGERIVLDLACQLAYEKFQNESDRSVLGGVVSGDLRVPVAPSLVWRTTLAGNYYSDSAYETADRVGGGVETGVGLARSRWFVEVYGGVEGRRYGHLDAYDDHGVLGTYAETAPSLGMAGSARVGAGARVAGRVRWLRIDSRDPLYGGDSWLAQGSVRTGVPLGVSLTLSALGQRRVYDARTASQNEASYWQIGAGLERELTAMVELTARYAFARSIDPSSTDEDLHRFTLSATWGLSRSTRLAVAPDLRLPAASQAAPVRENEVRIFRCRAPSAKTVSLVADFNGWDPAANPLRQDRGGWWQTKVRLSAGSHQYAYLVDGTTVTPADAEAIVDDGFGGKNGLIVVVPGAAL